MNFCSNCGSRVAFKIPTGDDRKRFVCDNCRTIHYTNPKIVVGCIPVHEDKILMCKRAIEPRYGFWTVPAGFLENGETLAEGAARETMEEAEAEVKDLAMYTLFNLTDIHQIYVLFRAKLPCADFGPGSESLDVRLFKEEEIPWDKMAFTTIKESLRLFFKDKRKNSFSFHKGRVTVAHGVVVEP